MGRLPTVAAALLGALIAVVVLYTKPSLSDGGHEEPAGERLTGSTSDGGRVVVDRLGAGYRWWIKSPPAGRCRAGWMSGHAYYLALPPDEAFAERSRFFDPKSDAEVRFRVTGQFGAGQVTGRYRRVDVVHATEDREYSCVRRGTFTATRSRHW